MRDLWQGKLWWAKLTQDKPVGPGSDAFTRTAIRVKLHLDGTTFGGEGLMMAVQAPPDLVLLDMNLPDMPGLEVLRRMRTRDSTRFVRCIAVSAAALPAQIEQAQDVGFDRYWAKPLDLPLVVKRLKQTIHALK